MFLLVWYHLGEFSLVKILMKLRKHLCCYSNPAAKTFFTCFYFFLTRFSMKTQQISGSLPDICRRRSPSRLRLLLWNKNMAALPPPRGWDNLQELQPAALMAGRDGGVLHGSCLHSLERMEVQTDGSHMKGNNPELLFKQREEPGGTAISRGFPAERRRWSFTKLRVNKYQEWLEEKRKFCSETRTKKREMNKESLGFMDTTGKLAAWLL